MDVFSQMSRVLIRNAKPNRNIKKISVADYEVFCREFLFNKLKDQPFGVCFCRKFEIDDFVLEILPSEESAKRHINAVGYVDDFNK